MSRPDALLFDLGRVLVGYDWTRSLQRLADRLEGVGVEDVVGWMLGPDGPHDPYCLGRIDDAALLASIHARFDRTHEIDDAWLLELWQDVFEPWPDSMRLVDELRGRARLALVSNTNPLHFGRLDRMLGLRARFDHVSLSYEVGAAKPEPLLYEDALAGVGVPAARAWFTDDLPVNVQAARALGMRAETWTGVRHARASLVGMGFEL